MRIPQWKPVEIKDFLPPFFVTMFVQAGWGKLHPRTGRWRVPRGIGAAPHGPRHLSFDVLLCGDAPSAGCSKKESHDEDTLGPLRMKNNGHGTAYPDGQARLLF
jgi:hypothetical protein